ncbi:MAG: TonB-dependent receptor [Parvularculaceae bacterium]|nr:TonB-dependent receptor [Parvularculaceae bacterium]
MKLSHSRRRLKSALLLGTVWCASSAAVAQTEPSPAEPVDEIVVVGRNIPDPQRNTSEVVSVLTVDDLDRAGDDNAALALTRLSGLSLVSGKFVYVRGLGDRYSSALLNGSPLPSPEPLRRQVPLDLFPSNILGGATVQKTFSPNYPGEFGGGIIDLRTIDLPDEGFLTVKLGGGLNTVSTMKNGLVYEGTDADWTGLGGSLRNTPPALQAAIDQGKLINEFNFTPTELETIGESLVNSPFTVLQRELQNPDVEGEVTAGDTFDLGGVELGLVGVLGYDSQQRTEDAIRQSVVSGLIEDDFVATTTNWDIVFNAFAGASLKLSEDHLVRLSGLLVRSTQKKAQSADGTDDNASGTIGIHREATAWYERQLASIQVSGDHFFGPLNVRWRAAGSESRRDAPYERFIAYDKTVTFPLIYSGRTLGNRTRFSYLNDQVFNAGLDADYTIPLSDYRDLVLSAGLVYSKTDRDYTQRQFSFIETTTDPALIPNSVRVNRPDFLFQPDSIRPDGFQLQEFTGRDDSYDGFLENRAAYFAVDAEIIPRVQVAAGVRYEDADQEVRTLNSFGLTPFAAPVNIENDYFLPAVTATWNFAEDMLLRAGFSQTIARPQFRELAFTPYVDPETDRVYQGNPFLTDSKFTNYDARYEYYLGRNQFVTLAGFYKKVDDPVEEVILASQGGTVTRFINAPQATLYGGEFEYRTRFDMPFDVPVLLEPEWLFSVNYTFTQSEVNGTDELIVDPSQLPNRVLAPASVFGLDGTELQGTPKHIVNAQFGWEAERSQTVLLLGWVSERITRRGLGSLPSTRETPGIQLDLNHKQNIEIYGQPFILGFSARNLLGADHEEFQLSTAGRTEANTYARGRTLSASLTAEF